MAHLLLGTRWSELRLRALARSRSGRTGTEPPLPWPAAVRQWLVLRSRLGPRSSSCRPAEVKPPFPPLTLWPRCQPGLLRLHGTPRGGDDSVGCGPCSSAEFRRSRRWSIGRGKRRQAFSDSCSNPVACGRLVGALTRREAPLRAPSGNAARSNLPPLGPRPHRLLADAAPCAWSGSSRAGAIPVCPALLVRPRSPRCRRHRSPGE